MGLREFQNIVNPFNTFCAPPMHKRTVADCSSFMWGSVLICHVMGFGTVNLHQATFHTGV
jgi:hypothetical protein